MVGLLAVAAVTSLTGCGRADVLGLRSNTQVSANAPAVTALQARAITSRALARAHQADTSRTGAAARTAFTGLALRTAAAAYAVDRVIDPASDDAGAALAPSAAPSRVIVPRETGYPRALVALSRPAGSSTDEIAVLSTPDARTPYRLASRALLLPGAEVPATASAGQGAPTLADDEPGLAATPTDAMRDYARLLQTGSSPSTRFAANPVTDGVRANAVGQSRGVTKIALFTQRHQVTDDQVLAWRTLDGGALVVAAIERTDDFVVKKGAGYLAPPAAYKALAGGIAKITSRATVTTMQVVVLAVPPRGKGDVRLIAFSEVPFTIRAR